ncbi:MAG: TlpA disulfide reductase family protein [Candidatus Omnitrophica bacterium]|nr:TlpA disulfide reductase family protein [Candidatus Omnitrophota bacterium]
MFNRKFRAWSLIMVISLVLGFGKVALAGEIVLSDLGGQAVNLSNYKGKPVILFFWTTWCPYCRQEIKNLNQQYSAMSKEGIVVFGVNVSESAAKVERFFKDYQLNLKILLDKDGLLADKYELMGVPTYIFLDKTGEMILQTHTLPDDYKNLLFKRAAEK